MIVAVLGASPKKDRYSNKAIHALQRHGHTVIPVAPAHTTIEGLKVYNDLESIPEKVDTLTVYVGPHYISPLIPKIVKLKPKRVILNPGTESPELMTALEANQIAYQEACTLVLLSTGQF